MNTTTASPMTDQELRDTLAQALADWDDADPFERTAALRIAARGAEAAEIAVQLGNRVRSHAPDWSTFELDDDVADPDRNATWRTTFAWESGRFEGHVFNVARRDTCQSPTAIRCTQPAELWVTIPESGMNTPPADLKVCLFHADELRSECAAEFVALVR